MASELDRIAAEGNILERLERLEARVRALESRPLRAGSLDEISDDLGVIRSGRFEACDSAGNPRLVLDGDDKRVKDEHGTEAHLLGLTEQGVPSFWFDSDTGEGAFSLGRMRLEARGLKGSPADVFAEPSPEDINAILRVGADSWGQYGVFAGLGAEPQFNRIPNGDFTVSSSLGGWRFENAVEWEIVAESDIRTTSNPGKCYAPRFSAKANTVYRFDAVVWVSAGSAQRVWTFVAYYDSSGNFITQRSLGYADTRNEYCRISQQDSPPTGTRYADFFIDFSQASGSEYRIRLASAVLLRDYGWIDLVRLATSGWTRSPVPWTPDFDQGFTRIQSEYILAVPPPIGTPIWIVTDLKQIFGYVTSTSVSANRQRIVFASPQGLQFQAEESISAVYFSYPVAPQGYPIQIKPDRAWLYRMGGKDWAAAPTACHTYAVGAKRVQNSSAETDMLVVPLPALFGLANDVLSVKIFGRVVNAHSTASITLRIRFYLSHGGNEYLLGSNTTGTINAGQAPAIFSSLDLIYDVTNAQSLNYSIIRRAASWDALDYRVVALPGVNMGQASLRITYTLSVAHSAIYADLYNFRATFYPQTTPQPV